MSIGHVERIDLLIMRRTIQGGINIAIHTGSNGDLQRLILTSVILIDTIKRKNNRNSYERRIKYEKILANDFLYINPVCFS